LLLLGIDIGGTKIGFSVGDETGKIHRRLRRTTQLSGSAEADLRRIAEEARHLIGAAGARPEELAAVGAAVAIPVGIILQDEAQLQPLAPDRVITVGD